MPVFVFNNTTKLGLILSAMNFTGVYVEVQLIDVSSETLSLIPKLL